MLKRKCIKNLICNILGILPDSVYLKLLYRVKTGKVLHLKNPASYTEKLNWIKINDRNPLYTSLVDKYEVRKYVQARIGQEYLIPVLGIWNAFDEIDFSVLPKRFVIKCTHDYDSTIIVNDKSIFDKKSANEFVDVALKFNFYYRGREWAYKNVKPRIIIEQNIQEGNERLIDYKFFCFGGVVKLLYVAQGRGTDLRFDFFDRDFNHLSIENGYPNAQTIPQKPECFDKMIELAEELARGINNVRVDLYNVAGKIYFGEMTFYHLGGMKTFKPYEFDIELGKMFIMNP